MTLADAYKQAREQKPHAFIEVLRMHVGVGGDATWPESGLIRISPPVTGLRGVERFVPHNRDQCMVELHVNRAMRDGSYAYVHGVDAAQYAEALAKATGGEVRLGGVVVLDASKTVTD